MQIDCYGFEASSQWFRRKELEVYLMKEVEGVLYLCYGNQPMRRIHRIDRDEHGCTRELWAFVRWADVKSLRYIPVNQTMEIGLFPPFHNFSNCFRHCEAFALRRGHNFWYNTDTE